VVRHVRVGLLILAALVILPAAAHAQASITGVVRDTSGAVLPGVTVEAASPALIEKVRAVVTDGTGQYRIENLRPGSYTVTFTLPGFATVKREGIELTGAFVATVNGDLRVGALAETITVTGETPVVDVQSTTRQTVLAEEVIDLLPTGRTTTVLAQLIPAVVSARDDVGGLDSLGRTSPGAYGVNDTRMFVGGIGVQSGFGGGATGTFNAGSFQEIAVDTGGISAESKEGGVRINLIPKYGGNDFAGNIFAAFANSDMQGSNLSQALRDRGLSAGDSLKRYWDLNPSFGGPIMRDRVWFYLSARSAGILRYVPVFFNRNAGNPNAWTYEPDTSRDPETFDDNLQNGVFRTSFQATPRNKLDFSFDYTRRCECPRNAPGPTIAPETASQDDSRTRPKHMTYVAWTSPMTSRLLFEAGSLYHYTLTLRPGVRNPNLHGVTEQSTGMRYRAAQATFIGRDAETAVFQGRAALSYITGAHALKTGFNFTSITAEEWSYSIDSPMEFRFNNGVPNRLTVSSTPYLVANDVDADNGIFIQDRWTTNRLTLTGGLRYDYFKTGFPDTTIGPGTFAPNRNITIPAGDGVSWHDLSPRSGVAYDVFGDGRTAVKASLNKYLTALVTRGIFGHLMAPANRLVTRTNRSWNDANRNFAPDCDLLNPAGNGECGAMDNPNFGTVAEGVAYDPEILGGWGVRGGEEVGDPGHYWQFSTGIQRELFPRVSVDVSYFRTWYGNFVVADNRALGPDDFDTFSITAPSDPRLPGGGGYVISGLLDIKPQRFGIPADDFITHADNFGKQTRTWNGFDVTLTARPRAGLLLQGGTNTGRETRDDCEILAKLPELDPLGRPLCRQQDKFQTTLKFVTTYTIPRVDVQVSGTYQDLPGRPISADYVATTADIRPSLGRDLAGGARNVTVPLYAPGTVFGDRVHQLDIRMGKVVRLGGLRTTASLDVYNVFNVAPVRAYSAAFATWQQPQSILSPRFAKVVLQFDF
jgi:hypothetical protein